MKTKNNFTQKHIKLPQAKAVKDKEKENYTRPKCYIMLGGHICITH